MKSDDHNNPNWQSGPYISIALKFYYAIDRDHHVNLLRNHAVIWSLAHNEDILVDELANELRIYVEHESALTLFALTCNPRVFDRYQVHYSKDNDNNDNNNRKDEH